MRAQPKVRFICECFVPHFVGECGCSESQVYIWWDFLSVSQTDHAMQKRQIECLPIFVAMSDAVCALRAGDEDFYAKEGAEMYDVVSRNTATSSYWSTNPLVCGFRGEGKGEGADSGIMRPRSSTTGC